MPMIMPRVAGAVWLLAAVAGVLLAAQQVQRHRRPALFSLARAERAIRAEKGLRDFWRGLDARAERSANELRQLHRVRLASGVGTAAASAAAVRDFRDAHDWGSDGADSRASVLADRPRRPDVGLVAYRPVHGSRARVEELADAAAQGRPSQLGGKRAVAETDHGLLGTSLGGLVRNVFGGPHSKIAEMSAKRGARTGRSVWSALGQPRWDSRGDPVVSQGRRKAVPERGLERAGVKVSNSLGELYKDVPASSKIQQKLSAQGEVHLMRLIDGVFEGAPWQGQQSLQHPQEAKLRSSQPAQAHGHNRESSKWVGGSGSFFADEHDAPTPRPNAGLVTKMLAPQAEVMAADDGSLAKQLKDDGMLVPSTGLFRDAVSPAHTPSSQVSAADTPPAVAPHHAAAAAKSESGGGLARARSKAGGETDGWKLADGEPRGGRASRALAHPQRRLGMYTRRPARSGESMHPRAAHKALKRRVMRRLRRSMRWRAGGRARAIKAGERARAEEDAGFKLPAGQMLEAHLVPVTTEKDVHTQVSAQQERHAVVGYFTRLAKQDRAKHALAMDVQQEQEVARPQEIAMADGSDRRDKKRIDDFFDRLEAADMRKSKRASLARARARRDARSLAFYAAASHAAHRPHGRAKPPVSVVPKAAEEWKHAEKVLGLDKARSASTARRARGEQGAEASALMAASADAGHVARTHRGTERRAGKSSARMHAPVERHVPGTDGASAAAMEAKGLVNDNEDDLNLHHESETQVAKVLDTPRPKQLASLLNKFEHWMNSPVKSLI